jgi:hypothetical protein
MDSYENTETKFQKGGKVVRKVSIKNGRGYKSITKYHRGKKVYTAKKPIHKSHISSILSGIFIPGLFQDCKGKGCNTKKRKGGADIEEGPEIKDTPSYPVPPDPLRFKRYEEKMRTSPISRDEAEKIFAGPTPEEKQRMEGMKMADEDPLYKDQWGDLQIFPKGGKSKTKKRRY